MAELSWEHQERVVDFDDFQCLFSTEVVSVDGVACGAFYHKRLVFVHSVVVAQ